MAYKAFRGRRYLGPGGSLTLNDVFGAFGRLFDGSQGVGSPEPFPAPEWHNGFGTTADYQVPAESFSSMQLNHGGIDAFGD